MAVPPERQAMDPALPATRSDSEDAFDLLGLPPRLALDEEILASACREAARHHHPDASGATDRFQQLQDARAILSSPSRRLRLWSLRRGLEPDPRGSVSPGLLDLFGEVGQLSQSLEALLRRRESARSALSRALLEGESLALQEELEAMLARLERELSCRCERFPEFDASPTPPGPDLALLGRDLAFLEKWRRSLRHFYSRLVSA